MSRRRPGWGASDVRAGLPLQVSIGPGIGHLEWKSGPWERFPAEGRGRPREGFSGPRAHLFGNFVEPGSGPGIRVAREPGSVIAFLEPIYAGQTDDIPPGSRCIANAYTTTHDMLEESNCHKSITLKHDLRRVASRLDIYFKISDFGDQYNFLCIHT